MSIMSEAEERRDIFSVIENKKERVCELLDAIKDMKIEIEILEEEIEDLWEEGK